MPGDVKCPTQGNRKTCCGLIKRWKLLDIGGGGRSAFLRAYGGQHILNRNPPKILWAQAQPPRPSPPASRPGPPGPVLQAQPPQAQPPRPSHSDTYVTTRKTHLVYFYNLLNKVLINIILIIMHGIGNYVTIKRG